MPFFVNRGVPFEFLNSPVHGHLRYLSLKKMLNENFAVYLSLYSCTSKI